MKIQFENCEVDAWRVRRGSVVMAAGRLGHIDRIGIPNNTCFDKNVVCVDIISTESNVYTMSVGVTWLEPHD